MRNILTTISIITLTSIFYINHHYTKKIVDLRLNNTNRVDSITQQMDSLCHDIYILNQYLDSLPLGSPLDTLIVSSNYGWRKSPVFKVWRMHSGTDFLAAWNDTVYSTGHGKVSRSGWNFGYGNQIKISHCSGYESSYAHLYKLFVRVGDSIEVGDPIARAGNSGMVTGPHLHYEISRWDKKTDPMVLLTSSL